MAEPVLTMRIEGLETLQKALADPELVKGPIKDALTRAGLTVEARAKQKAPVDTGRLRASIATKVEETRAIVGSNVLYASYVEFGTKPHFPPVSALTTWARRHGFDSAFVLARAISQRGTKAHPYLVPALLESKPDIESFLRDAARRIEAKWGK